MDRRTVVRALVATPAAVLVTSCSHQVARSQRLSPASLVVHARPGVDYSVSEPGPLRGRVLTADVLITSQGAISNSLRRRVVDIAGVVAALPLGVSSASVSGRTLVVASVDPDSYRRFTPFVSASDDAVWRRVADGEAAVDPLLGTRVEQPTGFLTLGQGEAATSVHVGAYAPLTTRVQAVVNHRRGRQLGIQPDNALLVSTGAVPPSAVAGQIKKALSGRANFEILATEFDVNTRQTAVLSGGSVTNAVGTFDYTSHPDGTVTPDAGWVSNYIRTEQVPIIGAVTGNRAMFPQLRGALSDINAAGLAARIHPSQYGGCYVPRYIAHNPELGLSLHSWGIAVDLNVPENQRGTRGHMDPGVIAAFGKWGFDWGGRWHYTDPMHFEMSSIVSRR